MKAGLSCNCCRIFPVILVPFSTLFGVAVYARKTILRMVSTLNLQPSCMKTAGGLSAQFLHLKFGIWFLNLFLLNNLSVIGANLLCFPQVAVFQ